MQLCIEDKKTWQCSHSETLNTAELTQDSTVVVNIVLVPLCKCSPCTSLLLLLPSATRTSAIKNLSLSEVYRNSAYISAFFSLFWYRPIFCFELLLLPVSLVTCYCFCTKHCPVPVLFSSYDWTHFFFEILVYCCSQLKFHLVKLTCKKLHPHPISLFDHIISFHFRCSHVAFPNNHQPHHIIDVLTSWFIISLTTP